MKKLRYLTGRLNVSGHYETGNFPEKFRYVLKRLQAANAVDERGFRYRFMGVHSLPDVALGPAEVGRFFIAGLLVKYKPKGEVTQFDEKTGAPANYPVPNKYIAASDFLLEVKHGLIVYHPIVNRITSGQFKTIFCQLVEEAFDDDLTRAVINSLPPRLQVMETLRSFDVVTTVRTTLFPSNPQYSWLWKPVDKRLKDSKASKYTETYSVDAEAADKGLDVGDESPVAASVAMASDGFGKATVRGLRDGEFDEYRTESDTREFQSPRLVSLPDEPSAEELEDGEYPGVEIDLDAINQLLAGLDEAFRIIQNQDEDDMGGNISGE